MAAWGSSRRARGQKRPTAPPAGRDEASAPACCQRTLSGPVAACRRGSESDSYQCSCLCRQYGDRTLCRLDRSTEYLSTCLSFIFASLPHTRPEPMAASVKHSSVLCMLQRRQEEI